MNPIETLRNKIYDSIGSLSDAIHRDISEHRIGSIMESLSSIKLGMNIAKNQVQ